MIQDELIEQLAAAERRALSDNPHERVIGLNFINGMVLGAYYIQCKTADSDVYNYLSDRLIGTIKQLKKSKRSFSG